MTSAYFELVRSSSSSMGGLVMPSGTATVPANWLLLPGPGDRVRYQGYQLLGRTLGRVVDDGHVELRLGRQLDAGLVEPSPPNLLRLGAPADQPPLQLLERRRRQEHELRVRHELAYLSHALQLDLEQGRPAGLQPVDDRLAGRPVPVAGVLGMLEELTGRDHVGERVAVDEVIFDTIDLPRPRWTRRHRHGHPHLGMPAADGGREGALADTGRSGQHRQPRLRGVRDVGAGPHGVEYGLRTPGHRTHAREPRAAWRPDRAPGGSGRSPAAP